jgi:tyrosyl-tRNA synthetase
MPTFSVPASMPLQDVLLEINFAASKSAARRLIDQKGIRLDGETLSDAAQPLAHSGVLQAGKRRFARLMIQ